MTLKKSVLLVAAFLAAAPLAGCATFMSHRRVDLSPFAKEMIQLAGELQYGIGQINPIYVREYLGPEQTDRVRLLAVKGRGIIRGTIAYSLQLVTLADSDMSGQEKSKALANYLDGVLRPVLSAPQPELQFTLFQLDTLVQRVGSQEKLLDALGEAQPVVNEIARYSQELFDELKVALDETADAIEAQIEADNAGIAEANRSLKHYQLATVQSIALIRMYRDGDEAALDTLYTREPSLEEVAPRRAGRRLNGKEMAAIEERLLFKLRALREIRDQLQPDIELYWKQQQELNTLLNEHSAQLRKAHVAVIAWARAHERLAAGVVDPAKIDLVGIARSAAGAANPLN